MIHYYTSSGGRLRRQDGYEDGCWVNVVAPDEHEIDALIKQFSLEPDFLRACLDEEESPRIETEDGNTLLIFDAPVAQKNLTAGKTGDMVQYYTTPVGILLTPAAVLTVSLHENSVLGEFADGVVKNADPVQKTEFLFRLLLRMAMRYLQFLKQMDKIAGSLEKRMRRRVENHELLHMLDVQKSLLYFSTSLKACENALEKLGRGRYVKLSEDEKDLLEDTLIEVKQAADMSAIYLNVLTRTMSAFSAVGNNTLSAVMKTLTGAFILFAVPALLALFGWFAAVLTPFPMWLTPVLSLAGMCAAGAALYIKRMY
ncbi:MAG: magnesium transporter CorA family protein [Oscillospiraceae bacterium]|nr:magnesium transporter CorA family protein [Oscillospiraceae bacterium]